MREINGNQSPGSQQRNLLPQRSAARPGCSPGLPSHRSRRPRGRVGTASPSPKPGSRTGGGRGAARQGRLARGEMRWAQENERTEPPGLTAFLLALAGGAMPLGFYFKHPELWAPLRQRRLRCRAEGRRSAGGALPAPGAGQMAPSGELRPGSSRERLSEHSQHLWRPGEER